METDIGIQVAALRFRTMAADGPFTAVARFSGLYRFSRWLQMVHDRTKRGGSTALLHAATTGGQSAMAGSGARLPTLVAFGDGATMSVLHRQRDCSICRPE